MRRRIGGRTMSPHRNGVEVQRRKGGGCRPLHHSRVLFGPIGACCSPKSARQNTKASFYLNILLANPEWRMKNDGAMMGDEISYEVWLVEQIGSTMGNQC